jgi:hypothetical protein
VAACQPDPEERAHDELHGDVDEHERNGDKPDEGCDRQETEPGQRRKKDLLSRLVIVVVLQEVLYVTSRGLSPHVSMMKPANMGQVPRILGRRLSKYLILGADGIIRRHKPAKRSAAYRRPLPTRALRTSTEWMR